MDVTNSDDVLSHSWEKTFKKFLKVLPSSQEDVYLLKVVIKFLQILVPCYKNSGLFFVHFMNGENYRQFVI